MAGAAAAAGAGGASSAAPAAAPPAPPSPPPCQPSHDHPAVHDRGAADAAAAGPEAVLTPPAHAASDDVLLLVFTACAAGFSSSSSSSSSGSSSSSISTTNHHQKDAAKAAAASFAWFRTALPLVCSRWHRLVLGAPSLWQTLIISPSAEGAAHRGTRRTTTTSTRPQQPHQQQAATGSGVPTTTAGEGGQHPPPPLQPGGCSPLRGGGGGTGGPSFSGWTAPSGGGGAEPSSAYSTPQRGASPVLGSSPDSDCGSYWFSQYAPQAAGASPRHISQRLSRLSASRQARATLSAHAVLAWLRRHPAVSAGATSLVLELSHHAAHHDFDRASLDGLLSALPHVTRLCMVGAVEGTDAYEALARLRQLRDVELSSASSPCLDGGLLALCFLPHLTSLAISLDIPPAFPTPLGDVPTSLRRLALSAMWLEELPACLAECTALTSISLERCQLETNPLPLLLTLPSLAALSLRSASRGSSDASLPVLLPMQRPQLQPRPPAQQQQLRGGRRHPAAAAVAPPAHGSSSSSGPPFANTSLTRLELVEVGLRALPGCVSQLVALRQLNLALNSDMGSHHPASCLPAELTMLSVLEELCLGNCGLAHVPPVVAQLSSLTRLELQGNGLSEAGFGGGAGASSSSSAGRRARVVDFAGSLRVLDLSAQGAGRSRMRGIPGWVGSCTMLTELRLDCSCLGSGPEWQQHASLSSGGALAAAGPMVGGSGSRPRSLLHSSSDVGPLGAHHARQHQHAGEAQPPASGSSPVRHGVPTRRSILLPSSASAPHVSLDAAAAAALAGGQHAAGSSSTGALAHTLQLQQLPVLLPGLLLLAIEGGQWEQRAVRDALQLVRQLERSGSRLQVVLPP